jgi:sedoheptulokinase
MLSLGIDIGTTSICAVVLEAETGDVFFTETRKNDSFIESDKFFEKAQDPTK